MSVCCSTRSRSLFLYRNTSFFCLLFDIVGHRLDPIIHSINLIRVLAFKRHGDTQYCLSQIEEVLELFCLLVRAAKEPQVKYVVASTTAMNYAIAVDPVLCVTWTIHMVPRDRCHICAGSLLHEHRRLRAVNVESNALLTMHGFVQSWRGHVLYPVNLIL